MKLKDESEQSTLSFNNENTSGGLSLKDTDNRPPLEFQDTESETHSQNPWDVPKTNTSDNVSSAATGTANFTDSVTAAQPEFYPGFDEPYVSTSTSTVKHDISFKEFYQSHCSQNIKKNINASAIMLYVCSCVTLILSFVATALGVDIMAAALDAFILLGLALGIHIGKSRVCAIIVLIYSILNCMYSIVATGKVSGYLIILAGIYATIYTFKARKEYNEYINS